MRTVSLSAALCSLGAAALFCVAMLMPLRAWASPHIAWGLHEVDLENDALVVDSTWKLDGSNDSAVPLAASLPATAEFTGATPEYGPNGRVVALHVEPGSFRTTLPWDTVRNSGELPVPIPKGSSVHRIVVRPALSFSADPQMGLIAQVGHYAAADIDVVARHRFDSRTDASHRNVGAFYVRGTDLGSTGAFRGQVELRRHRMGRAALVAVTLFIIVVLGLVVVHRRLNTRVRHERAEAYLEAEFDALD